MLKTLKASVAALLAVAATIPAADAVAQSGDLASFYEGETVTILIGHPPGGTYNLYAQLASRHLGNHIPGNPEVIVQHMPGGGGSIAAAHFANRAPNDGTMVALIPESLAAKQLLDAENSHWDMNEMRYIGRMTDVRSVMAIRSGAEAKTVEDLKTVETNFSCSGTTTTSAQTGAVVRYFAGLNLNMVCGYDSATASILAVLRGEADASSTIWANWMSTNREYIDSGELVPIIQFGLEPIADIPDVPLAIDLVEDEAAKGAMRFFAAGGEIGRALLAPPGLDEEKYQMFVEAFDEMVEDPAFLADAEENGIPVSVAHADAVEEAKALILKASGDDVKLLGVALDEGFR